MSMHWFKGFVTETTQLQHMLKTAINLLNPWFGIIEITNALNKFLIADFKGTHFMHKGKKVVLGRLWRLRLNHTLHIGFFFKRRASQSIAEGPSRTLDISNVDSIKRVIPFSTKIGGKSNFLHISNKMTLLLNIKCRRESSGYQIEMHNMKNHLLTKLT